MHRRQAPTQLDHLLSLPAIKVAPSFWFLNINLPISLLKSFSRGLGKTWFKFLGASLSKCSPNSVPVLVCIAIGKSGFFFEKKSHNRRFRKRWRRPQSLQFCGDSRLIRRIRVLIRPRSSPYTSLIVPAKLQDLRSSPSFTKSSMAGDPNFFLRKFVLLNLFLWRS